MAGPFFNQQYILSCHIFWKYDFIIFHLSNKHTFWKFYPYIQRSNKRWLLKKKAMVNFYMWNISKQNVWIPDFWTIICYIQVINCYQIQNFKISWFYLQLKKMEQPRIILLFSTKQSKVYISQRLNIADLVSVVTCTAYLLRKSGIDSYSFPYCIYLNFCVAL